MKRFISSLTSGICAMLMPLMAQYSIAQSVLEKVTSPDGQLEVAVFLKEQAPFYRVSYNGTPVLEDSPLGLITAPVNYNRPMQWTGTEKNNLNFTYHTEKSKRSEIHYRGNELSVMLRTDGGKPLNVVFRVSDNDIVFRYELPENDTLALVIQKELTGFNFPGQAKGFLTPKSRPATGFKRTRPGYEEGYQVEQDITARSANRYGYTFPALFRVGKNWALLSETGVRGLYCGSNLSDPSPEGMYTIAYPDMAENNGFGSTGAAVGLPAATPWRTITVGNSLKPVVETTIFLDMVEPLYEPSVNYEYGKGTWSWIMWQQGSINYNDQVAYIDLAADMGYEYVLIDAYWDRKIGYERTEELIRYAASRNVGVFLWYNSNGTANDTPHTPRNKMNTAISRKKEMKWMQENGVKGIKVDFFGGDKQETMRLYEDILSDANDYGLMVVFHGATMPRGWERMFPNFGGSEAVQASEMLMFKQEINDMEAFNAALYPFIRNAAGSMEFGGVVLNKRYSRTNDGGNYRRTTDVFQLATSVLFQNPVQFFAIAPNNLEDAPGFAIEFMKEVPTTWDETVFLDGYPGKYIVLARKNGDRWYLAGVNARSEPLELKISFPQFSGKEVQYYGDQKDGKSVVKPMKVKNNGDLKISIPPNGGVVITE